ncbi:MAG: tripartite tricarboxylate transporter substrate binding protein [Oxalobacteraceae bacterium]|nr:MAG: tripartite tricarboxylate transporter substrate binding protein [Oxalobacteraceae bacterium]
MKRRDFLKLSGAAALGGFSITRVSAQEATWPNKPVKIIVPYAPGGASDIIARPWADKLSQAFGQPFVIDNRGGAGGMIGTEAVAKAPADGYTFLMTPNGPLTIIPSLRQAPYDATGDLIPVGRIGDLVCGFCIHPGVGPKTFAEMLDYARKNPGKLNYGSAGLATGTHMRLEMLKYRTGVNITHVPYRGSADAMNDLLPGNIQMMNEINVLPHVKAGKLILLNINYPKRSPDFPEAPTLTELGHPNSDEPLWYCTFAPKGTPAGIVNKLNAKILEIAASDDMKKRMREVSAEVPLQKPDEISTFMKADFALNAELIKAAKIKLE